MQRILGVFEALLSATLFGLIPFFFVPLHQNGFGIISTLSYRFTIAAIIVIIFSVLTKKSLKVGYKNVVPILLNGLVYFLATMFLFSALTYMPSGIVTTIFFTNPIFVMILMVLIYKEKLEPYKVVLSLITCFGVALLSGFFSDVSQINLFGLIYSIAGGLGYAVYIIGLFRLQSYNFSTEIISIYIFGACAIAATIFALLTNNFQIPSSNSDWLNLFGLSLLTVVISNVLLITSIKKIGSVLVAILGAMEPITAVAVGIIVFHEIMNTQILIGILIVIVSVILITIMPVLRSGKKVG